MTDSGSGSIVRAFFRRRVRAIPVFSSYGDDGRLIDDVWTVGGQSKVVIGGDEGLDDSAIIRDRLLEVGGLISGSKIIVGSSMPRGVHARMGLPAGSEMLRWKLSLRLSRRSWSPPSPAKHPPGAEDVVDERDDVDDEDDDEGEVDIEEKQFVGDSTEMEDPATETVNMFRLSPSRRLLAAPRRRARGDSSNLIAEQGEWWDVVVVVVMLDVVVVDLGDINSGDGPAATGDGKTTLRDI
jgi:hypothetical protein